jgi:hypothetical protein
MSPKLGAKTHVVSYLYVHAVFPRSRPASIYPPEQASPLVQRARVFGVPQDPAPRLPTADGGGGCWRDRTEWHRIAPVAVRH